MKKNIFVKGIAVGLAATMALATLGACNGKKDLAEIDTEAINGYTFRVSAYRDFSSDPLNHEYADGADAFMKQYPGTNVEYLTIGDQNADSIAAAIAAGDVWDIQYVFTCSRLPGDIVDGLYEPIEGYYDTKDERIDSAAMKNAYFDGHYYGISNNFMSEANYWSYNENMFKENGIKTPHEYYAEGNWNMDSFMEIAKALHEKGLKINTGNFGRPDWILNNATKWNDEFTEVEIILDSNESRQTLDKFKTILYDYDMLSTGISPKREVAMNSDVVPNLMITNNTTETTDTIRYIYLPSAKKEKAGPHVYYTDSAFMTPTGSNVDVKAAAVELAIQMGQARKNYLLDYYKGVTTEEDYDLLLESINNGEPLARGFTEFGYQKFKFYDEMKSGKPVATYISEITGQLEAAADNFNKKVEEYRLDTGLSGEE